MNKIGSKTILIAVFMAVAAHGQSKTFEVVSFKVEPPLRGDEGRMYNYTEDPGRIAYFHISLDNLIARAYDVANNRISGVPRWNDSTLYSLSATLPPGSSKSDVRVMLRNLLNERLRLKVHTQDRQVRGFVLVEATRGSKLKASLAEPPGPTSHGSKPQSQVDRRRGRLAGTRMPIDQLAFLLSIVLDQPVVNQSRLEGFIEVDLRWTPESVDPNAEPDKYPSIFAAPEEQLGLRLRAQTVSAQYLIVDHVEREPKDE